MIQIYLAFIIKQNRPIFFEEVKKLEYLPHRGFNMAGDNKAHVYKGHLIIYHIQEPELVLIIDIIDSRQDSVAKRYY